MIDETLKNPSLFTKTKIVEDLFLYKVKDRNIKVVRNYKTNKEIERDGYICLFMIAFATILALSGVATILWCHDRHNYSSHSIINNTN